MNKQDQLLGILNQLKQLSEDGDIERKHTKADDLLQDALTILARNTPNKDIINLINRAYLNLDKWYA